VSRSVKPPMRVEQSLRLLPAVSELASLRALILMSSRAQQRESWTVDRYSTVGKRLVEPAELRARLPAALRQASEHLAKLWRAAIDALEAEQRNDFPKAVRSLLRAGCHEEEAGRFAEARTWFAHALGIAEELRERGPEIEALRHLGDTENTLGYLERAGRHFQRSFALAEAELEQPSIALACLGLGTVAAARLQWVGAESWVNRGVPHTGGDRRLAGSLSLALGEIARDSGSSQLAQQRLESALDSFTDAGDTHGAVRTWRARGLLAARDGQTAEALASYTQALQQLNGHGNASLEIMLRMSRSELFLQAGRPPDAEDELRRGEELAIANQLPYSLARLYVELGKLHGLQRDEYGFVFFEKALELCGGPEQAPGLTADVCLAYARFRRGFGQIQDARTYFETARNVHEELGEHQAVERIDAEMALLPAA